jgi:hypothetical protein
VRGLPPLPPDFFTLELEWAVTDGRCSTAHNIFAPGASAANVSDLRTFVAGWFFSCLGQLLPLLGTDVTCSACRLTTSGSSPVVYNQLLAPNVGANGTTNPLNGNLCLTWRTNVRGGGGRSHTLLPLSDTLVDTDHKSLRQISWAFAVSQAQLYLDNINALPSPDGGLCVLAVVQRSQAGQPLPASIWSPVLAADASVAVGTIQRRTRRRRSLSPF